MFRLIRFIFAPLHSIAKDLSIIRELYELELSEREHPIIRITEKVSKRDTTVSYAGVEEKRPIHKRWLHGVDEEVE